jgi:hypothetical protein
MIGTERRTVCVGLYSDNVLGTVFRNLHGKWRMGSTVTRSGPFVDAVCVQFPFTSPSLPLQFPFNSPSIPLQEPFEVEDEHGTDLSTSTWNIGRRQRVKALREGATKVHDTPLAAVLYCCAPLLLATERTALSTPTLVFLFSRHFRPELSCSCSPLFPLSSRPHTRSHTPRTSGRRFRWRCDLRNIEIG